MARLKPEHQGELRRLHDETAAIVAWLIAEGHLDRFGAQLQAVTADALAAQDLRGMRMIARDTRSSLAALSPSERAALSAHVAASVGSSDVSAAGADAGVTAEIIALGRIRNDREYDVLRGRLDVIEAAEGSATEASAIAALLGVYRAPE